VRTEARMEELAQAQVRTEARLDTLTARVEELAQAQLRTENEVTRLRRTIEMQIGGLGARWGMQAEEAFRSGMKTILEEVGFRAERYLAYDTEGEVFGRSDQVELDVVIQDGKAMVIEIKSSLDRGQVHLFSRKVAFYARKTGQQVCQTGHCHSLYGERGAASCRGTGGGNLYGCFSLPLILAASTPTRAHQAKKASSCTISTGLSLKVLLPIPPLADALVSVTRMVP
jgi:hypothetical protein